MVPQTSPTWLGQSRALTHCSSSWLTAVPEGGPQRRPQGQGTPSKSVFVLCSAYLSNTEENKATQMTVHRQQAMGSLTAAWDLT